MRPHALGLAALTIILSLSAVALFAVPSHAASTRVSITDFSWSQDPSIDLNESVTWDWIGPDLLHSITGTGPGGVLVDSDPGLSTPVHNLGDTFTVADPDDPGKSVSLATIADGIARRLTGLVVRDEHGRRATHGDNDYFQNDPHWRDLVPFHEYFDGDTGRGLGAGHQTGWTATIALLLQFRGRQRFD